MYVKTSRRELTSVGVDIGTSTSHLVFSKIVLEKNPRSVTEKFEVTHREVIHAGPIHLTPLVGLNKIDFEALRTLFLQDYSRAGYDLSNVDTGAVIITGETAKKENAQMIVSSLATEAGKFVAATAGPNYEALLAAHGSGAVAMSANSHKRIMNVDVGGGSSKIAVCDNGKVIATAAINVGGRLVATNTEGVISRLEDTARTIGLHLNLDLELGKHLDSDTKVTVASAMAKALREALTGKAESPLTRMLMMTPPLTHLERVDEITFSGGVAEYIYERTTEDFGDLGRELAHELALLVPSLGMKLIEPENKIRATVIGAGMFNLQVSGSTTFLTSGLRYPLRNLIAIVPDISRKKTSTDEIASSIERAYVRFDLHEGEDDVILAFNDAVRPSYENLTQFSKGVVAALPRTIEKGRPILMCFDTDVGNSVGNVMKRETGIQSEILSIDEIPLQDGDYIDIGQPVIEGVVVPVVVKTLVFSH